MNPRLPAKAERRRFLLQRGWLRLSRSGSETWAHPRRRSSFTLAAAFRAEVGMLSARGNSFTAPDDPAALEELVLAARRAARKAKAEYDRAHRQAYPDEPAPDRDECWVEIERLREALEPFWPKRLEGER